MVQKSYEVHQAKFEKTTSPPAPQNDSAAGLKSWQIDLGSLVVGHSMKLRVAVE
jgi:hypothetical protein